jgi:hypothetical protein
MDLSFLAGARLSQGFRKISYPYIYDKFANYYTTQKPGMTELVSVISIGTLLLVGFAYLTMVFYDIPIRKYLTDKRKMR